MSKGQKYKTIALQGCETTILAPLKPPLHINPYFCRTMTIQFTSRDKQYRDYQGAFLAQFALTDAASNSDSEIITAFLQNEDLVKASWPDIKSADTKELLTPAFHFEAITQDQLTSLTKSQLSSFFDNYIKDQLWFGEEEAVIKLITKWVTGKLASAASESCYLLDMQSFTGNGKVLDLKSAEQYDYFFSIFWVDNTAVTLSVCHMLYE